MADKLRASEIVQDGFIYISKAEANRQMMAMLTDIQSEIEENQYNYYNRWVVNHKDVTKIIRQKINALKGENK